MVPVWGASEGDSGVDNSPVLLRYPVLMWDISCHRFIDLLLEGHKEDILSLWLLVRARLGPHAFPEVALVIPQGRTTESPQNQVVVHVVPGLPDGDIFE